MTVHIVCVDDGHIIPRMARWLVDAHGWTMSDRPRNNAGVNLYMPYTAIVQGVARTPTAAWFTHLEHWNTGKVTLWEKAATEVDIRLTVAPIYMEHLAIWGETWRVIAGVDREHFTPDRSKRVKGRIGVAGLASPRKGPHLATLLYLDGYDVVAAGTGWDVPTQFVDYEDMPDFYRSLDVFLCTSLVEGIPAPPLEALACGTKVVVPEGVGMMSELIEDGGVRHYTANHYGSMKHAVNKALKDDAPPATFREIYDKSTWCDSCYKALSKLAVPA